MRLPKDHYLQQFDHYLSNGNLVAFERLIGKVQDEGISIDLTQISNVEQKISNLFIFNLQNGLNLDEIFRVLKFSNNFQLFLKTSRTPGFPIPARELELAKANLQSLFGELSDGFLNYILYFLPEHLSHFLTISFSNFPTFPLSAQEVPLPERIRLIYYYVNNHYYNYGLRTRKINTFIEYLRIYETNREPYEEGYFAFKIKKSDLLESQSSMRIISLFSEVIRPFERHLVYAPLLERIKEKYEHGEYNSDQYPIVGMVIRGGLGPEGKGFVYLTPTSEVIEVCSDVKQSMAYVIEYKKYLKSIFLKKLENRIKYWHISDILKTEILKFFNDNIQTKMVGYQEIETLFERDVMTYLEKTVKSYSVPEFLTFLKNSIIKILIPVQMEDQFKVRMDLITNNRLRETEIAKLASLGDVSHFDILNQRFFFLSLIDNIVRALKKKKLL